MLEKHTHEKMEISYIEIGLELRRGLGGPDKGGGSPRGVQR